MDVITQTVGDIASGITAFVAGIVMVGLSVALFRVAIVYAHGWERVMIIMFCVAIFLIASVAFFCAYVVFILRHPLP